MRNIMSKTIHTHHTHTQEWKDPSIYVKLYDCATLGGIYTFMVRTVRSLCGQLHLQLGGNTSKYVYKRRFRYGDGRIENWVVFVSMVVLTGGIGNRSGCGEYNFSLDFLVLS